MLMLFSGLRCKPKLCIINGLWHKPNFLCVVDLRKSLELISFQKRCLLKSSRASHRLAEEN